MRAVAAFSIILLALAGCAGLSRVEITSNKPVAVVADCIALHWSQQYASASVVPYATGVAVRLGSDTLLWAEVWPTVYGSWVKLSTHHDELVLRDHPLVRSARACAR